MAQVFVDALPLVQRVLRRFALPLAASLSSGKETLDLRSTDRTVTVYVEPIARDIGRPFHVSGAISWRWDAFKTARMATREEDLLAELLGRENVDAVETERPWLRIDIDLRRA